MRLAERRRAERAGQTPRTVREIDYLLLVNDEARQGALRFAEQEGGPFLADQGAMKIPPLIELPRLLSAAEHVVEDKTSTKTCGSCLRRDRHWAVHAPKRPCAIATGIS